jgi:hypothetical protein
MIEIGISSLTPIIADMSKSRAVPEFMPSALWRDTISRSTRLPFRR